MLDIRVLAYVVPLAEQVLDDITPVIQVRNFADEDATITGLIRIYRKSTDTLEYTSELATTILAHGTQANIAALSAWSPGAPADDDYFILATILATSFLPGPPKRGTLGAWFFDIKPGPMGIAPAAHHTTHEDGGMDEVDLTGLSGILGDMQPVDVHATSHQKGEPDAIEIANLGTAEADDTLVLAPDGAGGVEFRAEAGGAAPVGISYETDLLYCSDKTIDPWFFTTLASGTGLTLAALANHPGILRISSSTSANSGALARTDLASLLIAGNEQTTIIFRPQTLAGTTIWAGFEDVVSFASGAPSDGCYIEMAQVGGVNGVIVGKTASNATRSTTGTNYTLITNTWYSLQIAVNADATRVDFYLYDEAGALLWSDFLTTNIPTAAGRETGHGLIATNSGTTAVALVDLDYLNIEIARTLVR